MAAEEDIKAIEDEIGRTQYNKATQKHIGRLKAKIAKLRSEQAKGGGGAGGLGYGIKKKGDATVLLVGFPSVGKSTIINCLTSADSKVAEYDFTTLTVIPGVLEYRGAKIQILDVPGLIEGASMGRGRGREVISVIRNADLVVIIADIRKPEQVAIIRKELEESGLRLDKSPPDIKVHKKERGGIQVTMPKKMGLDKEVIIAVMNEFGVYNAEVVIREKVNLDQVVDALAKNMRYVPSLVVFNKADLGDKPSIPGLMISAKGGVGMDELKDAIWGKLGFVRVYLKRIGKGPDLEEPMILRGKVEVKDIGERLHKDFVRHFKHARIWGPSAQFGGQVVGLNYRLKDGDIVEMHMD